jgi:chromosome segregation ATPase
MVLRPVWKLQRALEERNAWLLLREERIIQLEQEINVRDDLLSLREQRIRQLEAQIEQAQEVVRDRENGVREREQTIALLETQLHELKITDPDDELRIEIDRRGVLLRQREARIRTLEIEIRGQEAELHLFRTALDQAEDILRKRDAKLVFLERQPDRSPENTQPKAALIGGARAITPLPRSFKNGSKRPLTLRDWI